MTIKIVDKEKLNMWSLCRVFGPDIRKAVLPFSMQLLVCIHLNHKRLLCSIGDWCFVCLVIHYSRCVLGEDYCSAELCVGRYSQGLSWRVIFFAWNLGLTREELAFYLGVSLTWTVECNPRGATKIKPNLFY